MNYLLIFCAILTVLVTVNGQAVQYAIRFKNFSIDSETGVAHLINMTIYQDGSNHKLAFSGIATKDIQVKSIEVIQYRCSYEKSDCENFQRWKFTKRLTSIVYMKNQMWSPMFDHLTPKLEFNILKKNIYQTPEASLNPEALIKWYPEVVNYVWQTEAILNDQNDKKAAVVKFEYTIFSFVERNRKRNRGSRLKSWKFKK